MPVAHINGKHFETSIKISVQETASGIHFGLIDATIDVAGADPIVIQTVAKLRPEPPGGHSPILNIDYAMAARAYFSGGATLGDRTLVNVCVPGWGKVCTTGSSFRLWAEQEPEPKRR